MPKESSLWLHGPEFFSKDSKYWPVQSANVQYREELCKLKSTRARAAVYSLVALCIEEEAADDEASLETLLRQKLSVRLTLRSL